MQQLIYNQRRIPGRQWRYGLRASARTGCGWVATYNALCILGEQVEIPELIRAFEHQLPGINGNVGTFIGGPALLLKSRGYPVRVTNQRKDYDTLAKEYPVCILSYYWRKKYRVGAHFVALHWQDNGFVGYNTFTNSNGPDHYGPSLDTFLKRRGYFGTVLTLVGERIL